jgi:phospholipase C
MLPAMMKRRDALKAIGGLGAATGMARFLPGCGGGDDGPTGITTYVYMMLENRSYDHYFGARKMIEGKPGDGLVATMTNRDVNGQPVALWAPTQHQLCDLDPPHSWGRARAQWNNGANDGFVTQHQMEYQSTTAIEPMQYLTRNELPVAWALADQYATADRWFCSVMGPTWPNRFYWHAGTSGGLMTNDIPTGGLNFPSIYRRLQDKGVDWAYYFATIPVVSAISGFDQTLVLDGKVRRFADFLTDAKAGTLPPVVYIDPAFYQNDDHPPLHPINGQELIATVYTAMANSPQWKNCMIVITYDENGGFYDHVSPPKTVDDQAALGFDQMGFRVPTMVAGPYVKENYISSVVYDHCSALHELEVAFGLEPLNQRTAAANDLSDFIDAERLKKGDWKKPIVIPEVDTSVWPMDDACKYTGSNVAARSLREDDHSILEWANAHPERIAGLDLRAEVPEYRRTIREFLAAHRTPTVK